MGYIGDFALGSTFDTKFTTIDSTGLPVTIGGTAAVSAYPDNSTTQITAGITTTEDFDGVTGLHNIRVVATGGNGYAAGSNYSLVLTTGTVDSISAVGYVIAEFSIEARSALRPTTAARTLDVSAGGEAGVDWANVGSPTTVVGLSGTTVKTATDVETDTADIQSRLPAALTADGNMKADTLRIGGTLQTANDVGADANEILADTADMQPKLGTPAGASISADIAAIEGQTDDIGAAGAGLTAVPWNAAWDAEVQSEVQDAIEANRLDELLAADSDIDGAAPPAVGSVFHETLSKTAGAFTFDQTTDSLEAIRDKEADIETDTQDVQSKIGTPAGASVSADLAAIEAQTDDIGAAGAGLTAVPWNAAWDAEVESEATDALNAYDPPTRTEATADKDEILTQLPATLVKNAAFTYVIKLVDSADHVTPKTGLTVTMTRSLDGAAFGAATGTVTEISTGHYKVASSAADNNADFTLHRFAATGADDLSVGWKTVS